VSRFKRGRERVVLETKDPSGDIRIFSAAGVRVIDDIIHFACREARCSCSRTAVTAAIEVESGNQIPALSRYGQDIMASVHDWVSFSRALAIEVEQAIEGEVSLSFVVARIGETGKSETASDFRTILRSFQRGVRWYDLVGELDSQAIAVLLPYCDRRDAAGVALRLAQQLRRDNITAEITWESGEVTHFLSNPAAKFPEIVGLGPYKFLLDPGGAAQSSAH
jgi:hypothetical protein